MNVRIPLFRSFLGLGVLGLASCQDASPPKEVALATEVRTEPAVEPAPTIKEKPIAKEAVEANKDSLADGSSFSFTDDAAGKSLEKTLTPSLPSGKSAGDQLLKQERGLPGYIDSPVPALPDSASSPPLLPLPERKEFRPTALPESVPPTIGGSTPQLPERGELPTGPLTKMESRDVSLPVELPFLSNRPVADRASLDDPTTEFTAKSVIGQKLPLRTVPAGFAPINIPDPFEFAKEAKPLTPVVENPNRVLGSPPPPR